MGAGASVARALAGSWRDPPALGGLDMETLVEVEEQLMRRGTAGLVWWRIRADPAVSESPIGNRFLEAFKMNTVFAGVHQAQISRVLKTLGEADLDPILLKGWDCARAYPHPGMRPYGDIDLCLPPRDEERARSILAGSPDGIGIDLEHWEIDAGSLPGLFDRSVTVELDGLPVRVMGPEDRLRTLAIHALKGEVWSPRSLCDVALAVESRPEDFAWEVCLTGDPVVRDWVLTGISLAGHLLGADLDGVPAKAVPGWVARRTLHMWSSPWPTKHGTGLQRLPHPGRPLALWRGLGARWPGPVQATLSAHTPFDDSPRLTLQLADVARRTFRFLTRQPGR